MRLRVGECVRAVPALGRCVQQAAHLPLCSSYHPMCLPNPHPNVPLSTSHVLPWPPTPHCPRQLQEEERRHNENALITLVCDSISAMVLAIILVRDTEGRNALFSTIGRLFEGLSDIAKAVLIILVADTMWVSFNKSFCLPLVFIVPPRSARQGSLWQDPQ